MKKGNKYGTHRVISPKGVLPQPADKLDNNMDEIYDNEILIDVQTLNIDSASFTQIEEQAGGDKAKIAELTNGEMCDITINNVNITDTEMTSILCTKNDGLVYFFSMATSFTKAALGAEGVGSDVTMIVGNGYTKGHAEITLQELRESEALRKIFTELYA